MADVVGYNNANPTARLDGVALDVEPKTSTPKDLMALLDLYWCIRNTLPKTLTMSVAIRNYWDAQLIFPGMPPHVPVMPQPFYGQVIRMPLDHVVVMGYRNSAGAEVGNKDGIIGLDRDAVEYANHCPDFSHVKSPRPCSGNKHGLVLAGLLTSPADPSEDPTNKESFLTLGQDVLNREAKTTLSSFGLNGFGGFAIINYQTSYLAGQPLWPTTNTSFPESPSMK
jgi:hypothetical protein